MRDDLKANLSKALETVVSWERILSLKIPLRQGCAWISDESIHHCFKTNLLEDARKPQTEYSHHAARVAWLVKRFISGDKIEPIHLHISDHKLSIYDGTHRVRASQFCGIDNIPAKITGLERNVKRFLNAYNK
jgi:hypothetical protein